jgi:ribosome-associated protein
MIRPEDLETEVVFSFSRSSGPGGQHVNKTESRVQAKWKPAESALLNPDQLELLLGAWKGKLLADGSFMVDSEKTRSQWRNKKDALAKLQAFIQTALTPVVPRKPSRISRAAKEKRRKEKEHRSEIKAGRRL